MKLIKMKICLSLLFILTTMSVSGQINLTITGRSYSNSQDTWEGVNIQRTSKTKLIFSNNAIRSSNRYGYMLQAGDESEKTTNNNLDDALITGNKLIWSGSDMKVIPHGLFTGHNRNVVMKYNYLDNVPMGLIRKSGNNMSNTGGGVAYNIVKNGAVQMVVKGMSNVNIYNNTFYTERTTDQTWRPLIHIYTNTDNGRYSVSHGTKIYNNIFYTKYQTLSITIADEESLKELECDYNVYWCENGTPRFSVNGKIITFEQWQAMGYDTHSKVVNPEFADKVNFVPLKPLDFGKDLGSEWNKGLSTSAKWGTTDPSVTTQGNKWQIGAVIHATTVSVSPSETDVPSEPVDPSEPSDQPAEKPAYLTSVIDDGSPSQVAITYDKEFQSVIPPDSSFSARINGAGVNVDDIDVIQNKVILTIDTTVCKGDIVTVSYTMPEQKALVAVNGETAESFAEKNVVNNVSTTIAATGSGEHETVRIYPNPVTDFFYAEIENFQDDLERMILIFNLSGQLCFKKKMMLSKLSKIEVDLPPGMYLLQVKTAFEVQLSQKIVVI